MIVTIVEGHVADAAHQQDAEPGVELKRGITTITQTSLDLVKHIAKCHATIPLLNLFHVMLYDFLLCCIAVYYRQLALPCTCSKERDGHHQRLRRGGYPGAEGLRPRQKQQ